MKFLVVGMGLLVATSAQAQIVTIHSHVTSGTGIFSGIPVGSDVTQTFVVDSGPVDHPVPPPLGGHLYTYDVVASASLEGFGALLSDVSGTIDIQDISFGYGLIANIMPGYGPEYWSTHIDVLNADQTFFANHVDGSEFDAINDSGYTLDPQDYLVWNIDSLDVSPASPVPEPSTWGISWAVVMLAAVVLRQRFRAKSVSTTPGSARAACLIQHSAITSL